MKEKLLHLMKSEGLKSVQLAEMLGIQPAGISHILAGRNKPSFDLLQKILRRFPQINPDWLLLDSDQMYRTGHPAQESADVSRSAGDTSTNVATPATAADLFTANPLGAEDASARTAQPVPPSAEPWPEHAAALGQRNDIARIIVLYTDHSFESFIPKK